MKTSMQVAQKLLDLGEARGEPLTPMALLKLVYLCHGWMLGIHDRPLIGERVEAWLYGPVIPDLYHAIKQFRSKPVTATLEARMPDFSEDEESIIQQVFDVYPNDGIVLSGLTHQPGTPWSKTRELNATYISDDLIKHHFKEQIVNAS